MKTYFLKLLLVAGMTGCDKDPVVSEDPLYRKWRIIQTQYKTGEPVAASASQGTIVTFTTNGTILYGDDGMYYACCSPARFKRKGSTLDLVDVASISLPERTPNPTCALVDCAPPDSVWQIETLTSGELVIKQTNATVTYEPYP